ncbi:MAG: thioredoxin-like domain-containing protein [Pirellulaceae bacterium]
MFTSSLRLPSSPNFARLLANCVCSGLIASASASAATPTVEDALKLTPVQQGEVDFDTPTGQAIGQSSIQWSKMDDGSGFVVRGPGGELLRRFLDTNSDNDIDMWCYYQNGIEVYRDIDQDFNGKVDHYRWLGLAGTRVGVDENEDGRIDRWEVISAEEVTSEMMESMKSGDANRFARILIDPREMKDLGLGSDREKDLQQRVANAPKLFASAVKRQRIVGPKTAWVHFGATRPGVLPAGTDGSSKDITVYENVVAMVENDGKHVQLPIGTLVKVQNGWRAIDIPTALMEEKERLVANGYFLQAAGGLDPSLTAAPADAISAETEKLAASLQKVEADLQKASTPADVKRLNDARFDVLQQLATAARSAEERDTWLRQLADSISAAAQSGSYPDGLERLKKLYGELPKDSPLLGYVKFRYMSAAYALNVQAPDADFAEIQKQWLGELAKFVEEYPDTPDATEARLQLAIAEEFSGNEKAALEWYEQILKSKGDELLIRKAMGAKRRLTSVGQPLAFRGRTVDGKTLDVAQLKGKIVLIHYWATWCDPCKEDLDVLRDLQAKYPREFALVGISLDNDPQQLATFLRSARLTWPQLYEQGGLDSPLAVDLGVLTLPTMILLNEKGEVVNRNVHITELRSELSKRLK